MKVKGFYEVKGEYKGYPFSNVYVCCEYVPKDGQFKGECTKVIKVKSSLFREYILSKGLVGDADIIGKDVFFEYDQRFGYVKSIK